MSLLTRLQQLGKQQAAEGQTEEVRQLQRTAATGKAAQEQTGPKAANLVERVARQQVQQQEAQIDERDQLLAEQIETRAQTVAQQFDAAKMQQLEQVLNQKQQLQNQTTQLLNQFARERGKLDVAKKQAQFEQLGFELRMNNEEYVQKLQQNGARSRLENDANFKEELQRSVFANEMELFNSDLDFQRLMYAEGRELIQALHDLDVEHFRQMGRIETDATAGAAKYSAMSDMVSGGASAWSSYQQQEQKKTKK